MDVFKLLGTIAVDASDANKTIDDTTGRAERSEGRMSSAFKKIGAAVVAAFATDKIVDFGKACVDASATVAAEQSSFEQIMGDYVDTAKEKVAEIADTTGMIDTRLTPYMTSMTAKFKGLGYDIGDATDFAQQGLNIAADAAAFWDKSLDDSMGALNSFVNGSYEGGEAIGLFANDTQMAAYAVEKGLVSESKEWASLDEKIKQATRLEYAENMQKQSGATGQAAKESGQYANVMANLAENWRQFQAAVGGPLLEAALPIIQTLMTTLEKLTPTITKIAEVLGKKLSDSINKILPALADMLEEIIPLLLDVAGEILPILVDIIGQLIPPITDIMKSLLPVISDLIKDLAPAISGILYAIEPILAILPPLIELCEPIVQIIGEIAKVIGLATGGFVAFIEQGLGLIPGMVDKDIEKFSQLDEEEQALIDSISELTKEHDAWVKSRDKAISDTNTEFGYYQKLSDELDTIVDKNGKVKKGYEDRAEFITTTLNESLGTEIEITDGVVKKYDEVIDKIDEVIEKKKAEAMLSANEATYTEAIKNVGEAQEKYVDALEKVNTTKAELIPIQSAMNDLEHMSTEEIERAYVAIAEQNGITATYGDIMTFLSSKYEGVNSQLGEHTAALEEAEEAYFDYSNTIRNYEGLSAAILNGEAEGINLALSKVTEGFLTAEYANAESLERQTNDLDNNIADMELALKNGMPGVTQEQIAQLKKLRDESQKEWDKAANDAGNAVSDMGTSMLNNKDTVTLKASVIAWAIRENLKVDTTGNGEYIGQGLIDGMISKLAEVQDTAATLAGAAAKAMEKVLEIRSPSRVARRIGQFLGRGFSLGVTDEEENSVKSASELAEKSVNALQTKPVSVGIKRYSDFGIAETAHNIQSSEKPERVSSIVNNVEISNKFNELIETIKSLKVYIDSGALVGEIAPAMDGALGSISKLKRRGL